jgi:hypothetical protein
MLYRANAIIARKQDDTGEPVPFDVPEVDDEILGDLGLSDEEPGRSHYLSAFHSAYTNGQEAEALQPELRATFPVYRYDAVDDKTSRDWHRARNGSFYPSTVAFGDVRGRGVEDIANCRCVPTYRSWDQWKADVAAGARIADGYPDVPIPDDIGKAYQTIPESLGYSRSGSRDDQRRS